MLISSRHKVIKLYISLNVYASAPKIPISFSKRWKKFPELHKEKYFRWWRDVTTEMKNCTDLGFFKSMRTREEKFKFISLNFLYLRVYAKSYVTTVIFPKIFFALFFGDKLFVSLISFFVTNFFLSTIAYNFSLLINIFLLWEEEEDLPKISLADFSRFNSSTRRQQLRNFL
jgi:hypothetical protein